MKLLPLILLCVGGTMWLSLVLDPLFGVGILLWIAGCDLALANFRRK